MPRMPHLARQGKKSKKSKTLGEPDVVNREDYEAMELDSRLELIRSLIPLGWMAVCEELEREVVSLDEGFEETLTLHRLGLFAKIGRSLKTTSMLESVNSQAEERCGRVDHRQN